MTDDEKVGIFPDLCNDLQSLFHAYCKTDGLEVNDYFNMIIQYMVLCMYNAEMTESQILCASDNIKSIMQEFINRHMN